MPKTKEENKSKKKATDKNKPKGKVDFIIKETDYHGLNAVSSKDNLINIFGEPKIEIDPNDGKTVNIFEIPYKTGSFLIYDQKMMRIVTNTANISWKILGKTKQKTREYAEFLKKNYNLEIKKL